MRPFWFGWRCEVWLFQIAIFRTSLGYNSLKYFISLCISRGASNELVLNWGLSFLSLWDPRMAFSLLQKENSFCFFCLIRGENGGNVAFRSERYFTNLRVRLRFVRRTAVGFLFVHVSRRTLKFCLHAYNVFSLKGKRNHWINLIISQKASPRFAGKELQLQNHFGRTFFKATKTNKIDWSL